VGKAAWRPANSDGYALTDALIAMLILSTSLVLGLSALSQARRVADVARETRRAKVLVAYLLEAAPHTYGSSAGTRGGFAWTVETTATGAERPIEICHRAVALRASGSGRTYGAATLEPCPLEPLG
jgi:Tfp pilus assembly protein PilV